MENYVKGEVQEVEDEYDVFNLGSNDVHMRVAAGSKIRNLMGYALKKMKEPGTRQLCWSGSGKAVTKTVSCVEIMKRKIKGLHQITEIRKLRVEEFWEPKIQGLERLKVNRDIPAISILLSKEQLDKDNQGYQAPGNFDKFWKDIVQKDKIKSSEAQKGKLGCRNNVSEGVKRSKNDLSGSKSDINQENKKRKFQNENKGKGRYKEKRDGAGPSSTHSDYKR